MEGQQQAPQFEPNLSGARYSSRLYDSQRRRSITVQTGTFGVEINYHAHESVYVSIDFSADEARAVAAELIRAADAAEREAA